LEENLKIPVHIQTFQNLNHFHGKDLTYLILLPIAAIPVLKKKLTGKWSLLYAFVGGNGFGFSIIGLMGLLS